MITVLVIGRNDGYGVNLHKRTAISLNHMATLCREPDDEIVYVDCNTPEHDLTLVEAIADTLTPLAPNSAAHAPLPRRRTLTVSPRRPSDKPRQSVAPCAKG